MTADGGGGAGSDERARDQDITQADTEAIHGLVDGLGPEELDRLGREAESGGGPLTERLMATFERVTGDDARRGKPGPTSP